MAAVDRALIIGGGIGGLCSAIALRRANIEVDLVEKNSSWTVYHVGIIVQGNAMRAMAALGIARECIEAGFPTSGLIFQDLHGRVLNDIPGIPVAGPEFPTDLGIARPALHQVLIDAARKLGTNIRLGTTFKHLDAREDDVAVEFTDGTSRTYPLVIGADGVNSTTRQVLFGERPAPRFTGQSTWRYNVPRPAELTRLLFVIGLPGGKAGFVPLTRESGYVLLVQSEPGNPRLPSDKLAEIFRERLRSCTGVMAQLRDQITDSALVVYRPLHSIFMPAPWFKNRVLLIGDAVHATTPHLGQGAAQAMEDAVVLGELFARDEPVPALLDAFMERRFERCKRIYEASLQIGEWEQHPTPDADPAGLTVKMLPLFAQPI